MFPHARRLLLISWGEWAVDATAQPAAPGHRPRPDRLLRRSSRGGHADELFHRTVTEYLHEWVGTDASLSRELAIVADAGNAPGLTSCAACSPATASRSSSTPGPRLRGRRSWRRSGSRRRRSRRHPAQRPGAGRPDERRDRRTPTARAPRPAGLARVRRHGHRRRALRARRRRVRLLGGTAHPGDRARDDRRPGGSSSRIRNYLGFQRGITGADLASGPSSRRGCSARRSCRCARRWRSASDGDRLYLASSNCAEIATGVVVLAMGVSYRRLGIPALEGLAGAGRLLRGLRLGGGAVHRTSGLRRRRRQLRRAGRRPPGRATPAR